MKKTLLFGILTLTLYSNAQMTQANEAAIGTLNSMYLCDSFAVNYNGISGAGVTWDYDGLAGYNGAQRDVEVVDPATTSNAADFTGSTFAIKVGTNLTTYYSSSASDRRSQGFVYTEPTMGDVIAKFDTDDEIVASYPFALGNTVDDAFAGNLDYYVLYTTTATGMGHATVDGTGTLLLCGNTLNNVLRYKMVDTSWATINNPFPVGDVEFIREQYEYYDYTVSNLPVLIHSTITVQNVGSSAPISTQSLVLSYYASANNVGLADNEIAGFSVYPNPVNDMLHIGGELSNSATVNITDQTGRLVLSTDLSNGNAVNVSALADGIYVVRVNDQGQIATTTLVKK